MDVFASYGILILSALITLFLMLIPSIFAIFLHYASGKYSRQKADDFSIFFILGVETATVLLFCFITIIIWALVPLTGLLHNQIVVWTFAGIFIALSAAACWFYYRKNGSLFVSRKTANLLLEKPQHIKKRSDAFLFGLSSTIPNLPFTIPVYALSTLIITSSDLPVLVQSVLIILFSFLATLPLFFIHFYFRSEHNLADFIRFRLKNRNFLRFFVTSLYLLIAILLIMLGFFPHG